MKTPWYTSEDLARWSGGTWEGDPPAGFDAIVHDSRAITPGCLFVAIRGERFDGHAFVAKAFEAGAAACLVDHRVEGGGAQLVVEDTRSALLALAKGYRSTFDIPVVGITGSVAKTTVKELTADLLATLGATARNPGNWNNDIGLPLSVLAMPKNTEYAVLEIGMNHPGELAPLCEVMQPTHAIVTEIGPAHIENFESVRAIAEEKASLVRALSPQGIQVLDLDSEWFEFLAERCEGRAIVVDSDSDPLPGPLAIPGRHMHRNAIKAVAMARHLGVSEADAAKVLAGFTPPGMRWAHRIVHGVDFINDAYNANPMSMRAALEAFADHSCGGSRWVLLGGMGELGHLEDEAHRDIGGLAAAGPWTFISVGELGQKFGANRHCDTPEAAARLLAAEAKRGDAVLIKGSRSERLENVIETFGTFDNLSGTGDLTRPS